MHGVGSVVCGTVVQVSLNVYTPLVPHFLSCRSLGFRCQPTPHTYICRVSSVRVSNWSLDPTTLGGSCRSLYGSARSASSPVHFTLSQEQCHPTSNRSPPRLTDSFPPTLPSQRLHTPVASVRAGQNAALSLTPVQVGEGLWFNSRLTVGRQFVVKC